MNMRTSSLLTILLLLPATQSSAEQAFTWVDDNGITHFSDAPPNNETTSAEEINLLPAPSAGNIAGDDFYSPANQADRMEKKRLENEKLVAERKQADAEARKANAEAQSAQQAPHQESTRYYPTYPYYPNSGHRPGHPGKPGHGKPNVPEQLPTERPGASFGARPNR